MRMTLLVALGAFATAATAAVFFTNFSTIVGSLVGAVAWALFAFGATNIESVTQCCITRTSEPALTWLGIGMVGLMIIALVFGSTEFVDARDADASRDGMGGV